MRKRLKQEADQPLSVQRSASLKWKETVSRLPDDDRNGGSGVLAPNLHAVPAASASAGSPTPVVKSIPNGRPESVSIDLPDFPEEYPTAAQMSARQR